MDEERDLPLLEEECDICGGTGEIDDMILDEDSHQYAPTGTRKCICRMSEQEDFSGASKGDR